jgi:hypothetical protein
MPRTLRVSEELTRKEMIDPQLEKVGWYLRDHSKVKFEIPVDGYDAEPWLFWEQSTDNVDPQSVIRCDVYVNGVLDHSLMGFGRTIVYGNPGVFNTYQVIAVDSAGNQSAPATLTTCAGAVCQ